MKNKIYKYDFLIVGGGLIGALTAFSLCKKNFNVLIIDKENKTLNDRRTLAVNANSKEFLEHLGIWNELKSRPQPINKIVIKDYINSSPLLFTNKNEPMGNVIFNREIHEVIRKKLKNLKVLKTCIDLDIKDLKPDKLMKIKNINYIFKKIIICVGKKINLIPDQKSIIFNQGHNSYVGFFRHEYDHQNIAYEIFKKEGPLAVLPSPRSDKKNSTFIYSTSKKTSYSEIHSIIKKNFKTTHGNMIFDKSIDKFPVIPHLKKYEKDLIFIGDTLRSIHPVAGQGWNLGVKDIQTLCKLTEQYPLVNSNFNSTYYSRRIIESSIYFGFTSIINFIYENQNTVNKNIVRLVYESLRKFGFLRDIFIKQAMGRINLID